MCAQKIGELHNKGCPNTFQYRKVASKASKFKGMPPTDAQSETPYP